MIAAALPSNETLRLSYLRSIDILDTPTEHDFDDVALLASQICEAPIAMVSLVDRDRQWFKAKVGTAIECTSRDTAFCAHAILSPDLMVVEDALEDIRFVDNPLVVGEPHVRFYAGMPLMTSDGLGLGTLCVVDTVPRKLKANQAAALQTLARQLVNLIKLRHSIRHDPLTGLSNRSRFLMQLQHRIDQAVREPNKVYAVLLVELTLAGTTPSRSNAVSQPILATMADRLKACLRTGDQIARITGSKGMEMVTGEQFLLLLDQVRKPVDAARVSDRILESVEQPLTFEGQEIKCTANIGTVVSGSARSYLKTDDIIADAGIALGKSKADGSNNYSLFNAPMHRAAVNRLKLETDLQLAIQRNELELHYQPVFSLQTGAIYAFEALLRWSQDGKPIRPEEFLSTAEDTGSIVAMGRWVIVAAVRELAKWRRAHPQLPHFRISINLTSRQLNDPELMQCLEAVTTECGISMSDVELETTEGAMMDNSKAGRLAADSIRSTSVRLTMDDFGVGTASLACLHRYPVRTLKIDPNLANGLPESINPRDVVQAVINLAHSLNITVVAEGLETPEQVETYRSVGCDLGQGYHLARPMDAAGVDRFLNARSPVLAA